MTAKDRLASVSYAWSGITYACQHEKNIQLELVLGGATIVAGFVLHLQLIEWVMVSILIALVIALELVNSALEYLVDVLRPRFHVQIKVVKDMMAGAVLTASLAALVSGIIIFWPHIAPLLFSL